MTHLSGIEEPASRCYEAGRQGAEACWPRDLSCTWALQSDGLEDLKISCVIEWYQLIISPEMQGTRSNPSSSDSQSTTDDARPRDHVHA